MDEKEWRECVKKHGYIYSDDEEDSDNESKLVLDDVYEAFKPPPILIDPTKHKIIEIGSYDSDNDSTATDSSRNSEPEDNEQHQKLTKSQKKRRRKKLLKQKSKNTVIGDTKNNSATIISNSEDECNNNVVNNEDDKPLNKDTPKAKYIASDIASTSCSEHESTNNTNGSKNLNGSPLAYMNTYHVQQNFLYILDQMLRRLNIIIENNPTDSLNIFNNVEICLKTIENFGIKRKSIKCVTVLLVETAVRFTTFINDVHSNGQFATPFKVHEFFYDMNTIILVGVMKQHGLDTPEVMNPVENLVFVSFQSVLMNHCEKIIAIIYRMTGVVFGNPFRHLVMCPGTVWESYYDMLHLVNLAKSIQQARMNSPQVVKSTLYQNGNGCEKPPLATEQEQQKKVVFCDKTTKLPVARCQSQLHSLIVDDLTANRRFFYDGSYFETNLQHWQHFQNLYLNEKTHKRQNIRKLLTTSEVTNSQSHLHRFVVDDLTRNRRFLHDDSYSGPNFGSWQNFQNLYLNGKLSILETRTELSEVQLEVSVSENLTHDVEHVGSEDDYLKRWLRPREKSQIDVSVSTFEELSPVEFPLSWTLTTCDVRILISGIIFVLFYRKILYCVFVIFCFGDVFVLVLLLLYLCAYFVIKF